MGGGTPICVLGGIKWDIIYQLLGSVSNKTEISIKPITRNAFYFLKVCDQITFGFAHHETQDFNITRKSIFSHHLCTISSKTDVKLKRYDRKSSELLQNYV